MSLNKKRQNRKLRVFTVDEKIACDRYYFLLINWKNNNCGESRQPYAKQIRPYSEKYFRIRNV